MYIAPVHRCFQANLGPEFGHTVKPVLSSHPREAHKVAAYGRWLLNRGEYQYKIKVWEHSVWLLKRQVGWLIQVTANSSLTAYICFIFLFGPIPNGKMYILFPIQSFPIWKAPAPFPMVRQITPVSIYSNVYVLIYISCKKIFIYFYLT